MRTRILFTAIVIVLIMIPASDSNGQDFRGLSTYFSLLGASKDLTGGFGWGILSEFRVMDKMNLRLGYNLILGDPDTDKHKSISYTANYFYLSAYHQKKIGFAWYPYVEGGAGFFMQKLKDRLPPKYKLKESPIEKFNNTVGIHLGGGIRAQVSDRLFVEFVFKEYIIPVTKTLMLDPVTGQPVDRKDKFTMFFTEIGWGISLYF
ncbi:hypothetical protein ACFL7D_00485 [candidate division KSB1 bacterium]